MKDTFPRHLWPILLNALMFATFACSQPEKATVIQEQVIPGELPDPTLIEGMKAGLPVIGNELSGDRQGGFVEFGLRY